MAPKFKDRPLIIASPPAIFAACLIVGGVLHLLFRATLGSFPEIFRFWGGLLFLVLAGVIAAAAFWVLHRHRPPFNPYRATTRIVQTGVFRFSRNPMYLSLTLLLASLALLFNAFSFVLAAIGFVVVTSRGVIQPEETYLAEKFGEEYRRYTRRVRRWL